LIRAIEEVTLKEDKSNNNCTNAEPDAKLVNEYKKAIKAAEGEEEEEEEGEEEEPPKKKTKKSEGKSRSVNGYIEGPSCVVDQILYHCDSANIADFVDTYFKTRQSAPPVAKFPGSKLYLASTKELGKEIER